MLEYGGPSPQPLFIAGRDDGIEAILRDVITPSIAYVACLPASMRAVETRYRVESGPQMVRMWVDRETFRPALRPRRRDARAERCRRAEPSVPAWVRIVAAAPGRRRGRVPRASGSTAGSWPPRGTHVIGRTARIAVVGNVLTQPEFRGRGYAQATTAAVTAKLLEFCDHVVLNVRSDNPPALNAYRRLGYAEHVRFEERLGHRIGSLWADIASALRRFAQRREQHAR